MCTFQIKEGSLTSSFGNEFHGECNTAGQIHKTPGDYIERNTKGLEFSNLLNSEYLCKKIQVLLLPHFNHYT